MPSEHIHAPFTPEQVKALNVYQQVGVMHPFTCGRCRDADERWPSPDEHLLTATEAGWVCPCPACDYTQDWAHAFMADPEWMKQQANALRSVGFTVPDL